MAAAGNGDGSWDEWWMPTISSAPVRSRPSWGQSVPASSTTGAAGNPTAPSRSRGSPSATSGPGLTSRPGRGQPVGSDDSSTASTPGGVVAQPRCSAPGGWDDRTSPHVHCQWGCVHSAAQDPAGSPTRLPKLRSCRPCEPNHRPDERRRWHRPGALLRRPRAGCLARRVEIRLPSWPFGRRCTPPGAAFALRTRFLSFRAAPSTSPSLGGV